MAKIIEVRVPDIGDFDEVPVIEIMVAPGDSVEAEDALLTLESDKASMDIPAPASGVVKEIAVAVGDNVSEGSLILTLEGAANESEEAPEAEKKSTETPAASGRDNDEPEKQSAPQNNPDDGGGEADKTTVEVRVPDIGDFSKVPVIEIFVEPGSKVETEESLVTLESDKASMDIPSPAAGTVRSVAVKTGDEVSEGDLLLVLEVVADIGTDMNSTGTKPGQATTETNDDAPTPKAERTATEIAGPRAPPTALPGASDSRSKTRSHATPSVRRFARELGADLNQVTGTGRKGRILREDLTRHVKDIMSKASSAGASGGVGLPVMPAIDFSKFGEVEVLAMSRIKKLAGHNLHRAWLVVPHVTHHDEADITEMEAFRKASAEAAKQRNIRLTPLAFIMKACVKALQEHPHFNASLDPGGETLILKHYFHLGVAVDTPDGLMVPVVRDVNKKGIEQLAVELAELSAKARDKKLAAGDLQGASFTISSLGGIGGTGFTPIVNAPEVAILGVSRSSMKPVYSDGEFLPRLMLPLSLSYDHRVIDGAGAARFTKYLCDLLSDIRRLLL